MISFNSSQSITYTNKQNIPPFFNYPLTSLYNFHTDSPAEPSNYQITTSKASQIALSVAKDQMTALTHPTYSYFSKVPSCNITWGTPLNSFLEKSTITQIHSQEALKEGPSRFTLPFLDADLCSNPSITPSPSSSRKALYWDISDESISTLASSQDTPSTEEGELLLNPSLTETENPCDDRYAASPFPFSQKDSFFHLKASLIQTTLNKENSPTTSPLKVLAATAALISKALDNSTKHKQHLATTTPISSHCRSPNPFQNNTKVAASRADFQSSFPEQRNSTAQIALTNARYLCTVLQHDSVLNPLRTLVIQLAPNRQSENMTNIISELCKDFSELCDSITDRLPRSLGELSQAITELGQTELVRYLSQDSSCSIGNSSEDLKFMLNNIKNAKELELTLHDYLTQSANDNRLDTVSRIIYAPSKGDAISSLMQCLLHTIINKVEKEKIRINQFQGLLTPMLEVVLQVYNISKLIIKLTKRLLEILDSKESNSPLYVLLKRTIDEAVAFGWISPQDCQSLLMQVVRILHHHSTPPQPLFQQNADEKADEEVAYYDLINRLCQPSHAFNSRMCSDAILLLQQKQSFPLYCLGNSTSNIV